MKILSTPSLFVALTIAIAFVFAPLNAVNASDATQLAAASSRQTDVYLLRGFGDVFSRGLDQMASTLKRKRVKATVLSHGQWQSVVKTVIANRKKYGRRPVILIGHSLGANAALRVAKALKKKGIPVSYMATFAATAPQPASSNIRRLTNYYFKTEGWGKPIKKGAGFRGILKNVDFSKNKKIGHFNIDKNPRLQRQVVRNVLRYVGRSRRADTRAKKPLKTAG